MEILFFCGVEYKNKSVEFASWIEAIIESMECRSIHVIAPCIDKCHKPSSFLSYGKEIVIYPYYDAGAAENQRHIREYTEKVSPEMIVIFGTESKRAYDAFCVCRTLSLLDRTVVFAQGFACVCYRHYVEGLPHSVVGSMTVRDMLRRDTIKSQLTAFLKRSEKEKEILAQTRHFIGRTTMDYSLLRSVNGTAEYYRCNDVMRDCFYTSEWDIGNCQKHRIFISQYYYPLKGFHYLLEAAAELKERYPDLSIVAAGYNPIGDCFRFQLKDSGYIRYIKQLIAKYRLQEHLSFVGMLSAEQMKEQYLKANVFIMPSTIENSPNSLAEAMLLGVPSVVADVGGVSDYARHSDEAYIYPSTAPYLLSHYISELFDNDKKAISMGANGRKRAIIDYDKLRNTQRIKTIFDTIIEKI